MRNLSFIVGACLFSLFAGHFASAGSIALPWSTSFDSNCSQDTTYPSDGAACGTNNTVSNYINVGACTANGYQQISSTANYPGGAGGRGARKFICDGTNDSTGHYDLTFASPQTDFYIRFYTRWQPGFKWSSIGWEKFVANYDCSGYSVAGFAGWDNTTMQISTGGTGIPSGSYVCNQSTGTNLYSNLTSSPCKKSGWDTIYANGPIDSTTGHHVSDGTWHAFEFHIKLNSSPGSNDGVYEQWVDGVQTTRYTNVNYFATSCPGMSSLELMVNQSSPQNGTAYYQDIDDIAISNTGPIGFLSGTVLAKPDPPTNLR